MSHPTCEAPFPPRRSGLVSSRPARCTRGAVDRFGIPNPRKSGSVIGADRQRFGPSCVLLKRVPQGRTESGGIALAANAGPRVPSGGVTLKRRCTSDLQSSLIVNKLLSLSLSLPPSDYVALKYWCWRTGEEPLHAEYGQVQRGVSSVYHQLSHSSPGCWGLLQPVA